MSQFSPQVYFNKYKVSVKPHDWIRRKLIIPKLNLCLLPYFCGADISLKMEIEPISHVTLPETIKYDLVLYKKGSDGEPEIFTPQNNEIIMTQKNKVIVKLRHFSFTDEYELVAIINNNKEMGRLTVADFEITSRANMQLSIFWFIAASVASIITLIVGAIIGYGIGS